MWFWIIAIGVGLYGLSIYERGKVVANKFSSNLQSSFGAVDLVNRMTATISLPTGSPITLSLPSGAHGWVSMQINGNEQVPNGSLLSTQPYHFSAGTPPFVIGHNNVQAMWSESSPSSPSGTAPGSADITINVTS